MTRTSPSTSNHPAAQRRNLNVSPRRLHRLLTTVVVFSAMICAPVHGIVQTKEQEKRGVGSPPAPAPSLAGVTSSAAIDKPELVLQTGHTKSINAVAFSPDNRWLASGGKDNLVKIWDLSTGNLLRTLYGHTSNVDSLAVSPDGKLLASGSGDITDKRDTTAFVKGGVVGGEDNTVRIWNVQTGRQVQILRGHELPVGALAFSNDGRSLTSVSGDAIKVWDVSAGTELHSQKPKYEKTGMEKFSGLAAFGLSGNKERKEEMQRGINFKLSASKLAVSSNGQVAAIGQPDKAVEVYDAQAGREVRPLSFKVTPEAESSSVAFSADARFVAFAKTTDTVSVQEVTTERDLYGINTGSSKTPQRVQFSPDGRFLVTATDNDAGSALKLWDAASGQLVRELRTPGNALVNVRAINFNGNGGLIAVVGEGSRSIRIIDSATGLEARTLQAGTINEVTPAEQAAFIRTIDPQTMATLQKRGVTTPEEIIEAVEAMATISSDKLQAGDAVTFNQDGHFLISNHVLLKNTTTEVWDAMAGTLASASNDPSFRDRGKPFFSPDGRFRAAPFFPTKELYSASLSRMFNPCANGYKCIYQQKINLYDGKSDKHLRELDGGKAPVTGMVPAAGFSFDGRLIAMTGFENKERSILIYETETGRKTNSFQINDDDQSGQVTTLCMSADSHLLAAGYGTKINIFEVATGKTLRTLPHSGRIVSLSFSPDARFLVALGENNDKYIWNAASGEELATLVNFGSALNHNGSDWLVVTPDGLFDGSPAAWKQILWRFGGNTFDVLPAETFFNEFYYPGLFADVMAGKKPRAPKNISQLDRRQPELKLSTQSGPAVAERNVTVKIEVTEKPGDKDHESGSGARDVRLFRNGSLVKAWRGDVLKGQTKITLETKITVVAGENRLVAYAFNRDNVKSKDAELNLNGAESLRRPGTAYILAIGVNAYSNNQYNLKYAVADATAFGEEVQREQQRIGNYQHVELAALLDEQATKANVLGALRRLAGTDQAMPSNAPPALEKLKSTEPEDAVFIYFAGHGTAQGQRFYLLPHDLGYTGERTSLDAAGLQMILEHGISDQELEQTVEGIDADKFLMVIDACNSGQALEAEERRRGPMNSKGLAQLAYEKGMYILTAAQSYQAAKEASQLGHGLLTYALVEEGLKQDAADNDPKDGEVLVREWFDYASTRVPSMQLEKIKLARGVGVNLSFMAEAESIPDSPRLLTQTPRMFYRREVEARPLIIAKR